MGGKRQPFYESCRKGGIEMKVLQFASYPVLEPRHGGQLRVSAIRRTLLNNGSDTAVVSFFDEGLYADRGRYCNPLPRALFAERQDRRPWDVSLSEVVLESRETVASIEQLLVAFSADVYIFEQPWLWILVREIISRRPELKRPIVYSSQNVEFRLLQDMGAPRRIVELAYVIEKELIENSDLLVTCTEADRDFFAGVFSVKKSVCLHNGIDPHLQINQDKLQEYQKKYRGKSVAAFVGSAHPPNVEGFFQMLGTHLGYLSPDQLIVLIGGVAESVYWQSRSRLYTELNDGRCDFIGKIPQEDLEAILSLCNVIVLPVVVGGGSNLKTAEALVSRKPILATSNSFRGYSEFISFPNVKIEDDPMRMRRKLHEMLLNPQPVTLTANQEKALEKVYWENILSEYPQVLKGLVQQ